MKIVYFRLPINGDARLKNFASINWKRRFCKNRQVKQKQTSDTKRPLIEKMIYVESAKKDVEKTHFILQSIIEF